MAVFVAPFGAIFAGIKRIVRWGKTR
jgi:hypothetical protein